MGHPRRHIFDNGGTRADDRSPCTLPESISDMNIHAVTLRIVPLTSRSAFFLTANESVVFGETPATQKPRLKTLLLLIITKAMGLVIGDRVKVLAHTAN